MVKLFFFTNLLVIQIISAKTAGRDVQASGSVNALSHGKDVSEKSSRTEAEDVRGKRSDDGGRLEAAVMQQAQELSSLQAQLAVAKAQLDAKGSTFVRWGRSQCPSGATTIYSGYAGGGNSNNPGAGANRICMTKVPVYDDMTILSAHGTVYGAQYHLSGHSHATDVMCSLCHTPFFTTFMVPGTNTCPDGTTEQYHGYLSVGNYGSTSASEFLCLDSNPEDRPGTTASLECAWFDHTVTVCGSLPCPPYVSGKAVTCVVCSK